MAGLLLAAGAGRRMGAPKGLLRDPDGTAWVARSATALLDGGCSPVHVVVGAQHAQVAQLVPPECRIVRAAAWQEGMGASLRAGLAEVGEAAELAELDAVLISLVDLPAVGSAMVARLLATIEDHAVGRQALVRACYQGVPGHPVLLGRAHWAGVAATASGDSGARDYLHRHEDQVRLIECSDLGSGHDLDAPADVADHAERGLTLLGVSLPARPDPTGDHPALAAEYPDGDRAPDTSRLAEPARRVTHAEVTPAPLDVHAHEAAVADPSAGAVVTFSGVVRDHDGGRRVTGIEYVAHPSAQQVLEQVVAEVALSSTAEAIAVSHRIGELAVGESAIVVAVSGAHRQEAFLACARVVDEVKHRLPVWKRQVFTDGTDEWVACP